MLTRIAAAALKVALSSEWGEVAPALKAALAGRETRAVRQGVELP